MRPLHHIRATSAAIREQERLVFSKRVIRYPNAVIACQWTSCASSQRNVVLVWTVDELEALEWNVASCEWRLVWSVQLQAVWTKGAGSMSPSLDCCDLSALTTTSNSSLSDAAVSTMSVLWATQGRLPIDVANANAVDNAAADNTDDKKNETAHVTSLYRLQWENDRLERREIVPVASNLNNDESSPYDSSWMCLTAIWDDASILVVGQQPAKQDQWELMRLHKETLAIQNVAVIAGCGRVGAAASAYAALQLHGSFICLSSHKGIRLYDAETLTLLQTYGESVQLHGKTVTWQSAMWIPAPVGTTTCRHGEGPTQVVRTAVNSNNKKHSWFERTDELAYRDSWSASKEHWLIGVPHPTKGPMELNSTLYVWKPGQGQAITTLQAPAGGLLGACGVTDFSGWRLLSATFDPNGMWEWRSTMQSNFAGVMYPVGYQVISNNLEYIEDEDELDRAVKVLDEEHGEDDDEDDASASADEPVDKDLAEALRLSLLEQQKTEDALEEAIVSVLVDEQDEPDQLIPCWPDASLREQLLEEAQGGVPGSPVKDSPKRKDSLTSEVLSVLPEFKMVRRELLLKRDQEMDRKSPCTTIDESTGSAASSLAQAKPKSKRSRTANVEALLQASIDPVLRQKMVRLHKQWGDGSKSTLHGADAVAPVLPVQANGESKVSSIAQDLRDAAPVERSTVVAKQESLDATSQSDNAGNAFENRITSADGYKAKKELSCLGGDSNGNAKEPMEPVQKGSGSGSDSGSRDDSVPKPSPLAIVASASAEEKELALELLLLSPSKASPKVTDATGAPSMAGVDSASGAGSIGEPKTEISAKAVAPRVEALKDSEGVVVSPRSEVTLKKQVSCAACRGRMVIHSCGTRETPVDYEAIATAEKEKKEKEEAEKQRLRIEKRRAAEAKRREARRRKKEEDEHNMRQAQERMRQLEAEQFERAHVREHEEGPVRQSHIMQQSQPRWNQDRFQPSVSPLVASHGLSDPPSTQTQASRGFDQGRNYYHQQIAGSVPIVSSQAPPTNEASQTGYYQYEETPAIPTSAATIQSWDAQKYASTSFATDSYYQPPQSAPPVAVPTSSHAWGTTAHAGSGVHAAQDGSSGYHRSESAPPVAARSTHDVNHPTSETAPPAAAPSTGAEPPPRSSLSIDASELKPSMALSTTDALAALAGLANCMPAATSHGFGAPPPAAAAPPESNGSDYTSGHGFGSNQGGKTWSSNLGSINKSAPLSSLVEAPQTLTNGNQAYASNSTPGQPAATTTHPPFHP